jgi:RNA-binding protein YhbY
MESILSIELKEQLSRNRVVKVSVSNRSSSATESSAQPRTPGLSLYESRVSVISKQFIKFRKDNSSSEMNWLRFERLQGMDSKIDSIRR